MEQQQIGISLSLGTKLLLSIVSLVLVIIIFLNISAIFLFRDDKRAYTYQRQSTEVLLAGREFVSLAKHALDTLHVTLGAVDPRVPISEVQKATLKTLVKNQSEVLMDTIYLLDRKTGKTRKYFQISKDEDSRENTGKNTRDENSKTIQETPEYFDISPPLMLSVAQELETNSYCFLNFTKLGGASVTAIVLADTTLKDNPGGMPIAVGIVSLAEFGSQLGKLSLSIATRTGRIIYDSDPTAVYSEEKVYDNPLFKAATSQGVANGAQEFDIDGVHYLGSYYSPGLDLVLLTRSEWMIAMKATYVLVEKFILLGSMAVGFAIVFAILFSKTMTAPINSLYDATREVAKGNFLIELKPRSKDEIGALSNSFNSMSKKISELIKESMDKVQLENELAIASTVQQNLIPPAHFKNENIDIYSQYQSASSCGGDWWGFFGVGKKIAFMIADATGHGFPSALITASARSCFSVMHKLALEDPDFSFSPDAMLDYANRVIYDASLGKIMMTFFIGVLDFETNTLSYSSAGHNPPWLFHKNETGGYSLKSLVAPGNRLGETNAATTFEELEVPISADDIIFIYTDGLTEGKNLDGKMYGKKKVKQMVEANLEKGPELVIDRLMEDFLKYNEGKSLDDDVTMAAIKILSGEIVTTTHA